MHPIPFHRRVLPWVYLTIFLVLAPVLLLYTAGYDYNTKKQTIERSGTLIVDTTPRSARILIDGTDTHETTPTTFQHASIGTHRVRVERDGYLPWERDVDIKPEQVTFANNVILWKDVLPVVQATGTYTRIASDPQGTRVALLATSTQGIVILYDDTARGMSAPQLLKGSTPDMHISKLAWDTGGKAVLISDDGDAHAWWSKPLGTDAPFAEALPQALYRWTDQGLLGINGNKRYRLDPELGHLERDTMEATTVDEEGSYALHTSTSSAALLLTSAHFFSDKTYALPNGAWHFTGVDSSHILVQDQHRYMSVNVDDAVPSVLYASGDALALNPESKSPMALLGNNQELWLWDIINPPELLRRESSLAPSFAWHRSGFAVLFANQTTVFASNLYHKTDRTTQALATFDRIFDITVQKKSILVAGIYNGVAGMYTLTIE